jgi:hypothetical protein
LYPWDGTDSGFSTSSRELAKKEALGTTFQQALSKES